MENKVQVKVKFKGVEDFKKIKIEANKNINKDFSMTLCKGFSKPKKDGEGTSLIVLESACLGEDGKYYNKYSNNYVFEPIQIIDLVQIRKINKDGKEVVYTKVDTFYKTLTKDQLKLAVNAAAYLQ